MISHTTGSNEADFTGVEKRAVATRGAGRGEMLGQRMRRMWTNS